MPIKDPPVDPGTPPVFDPDTFAAKLLSEFDKRVNALDKKITAIGKAPKASDVDTPPPADPPAIDPKPNPAIADPAVNAELISLRKDVARLTKENKTSADERDAARKAQSESERVGAIRAALQEIPFRTTERGESLIDQAYKLIAGDVVRADDGGFVVNSKEGGPLLLKDFVKSTFLEGDMSFMVQPKGSTGGAGARPGQAPGSGGRSWHMADLDPGKMNALPPDQQQSLATAVMNGQVLP
jgi:hypothetical protein